MKKYVWITVTILLAVLVVTGCSIVPGAEMEQEAKAEPLDAAAWPTAQPSPAPAEPTPFPKITLAPTATPSPRPTEVAEATPTPLTAGGMSFSGSVSDLQAEVSALSGGFKPVAVAFVTAPNEAVRQGPSATSGQVGAVETGELAGVLGTNAGVDWLYVITISGTQGWLPTTSLRITGSLAAAPVLPDNPLAAAAAISGGGPSQAPAAISLETLQPVASATVNNQVLNMRQGPGAAYGLLTSLAEGDKVSILATNATRDWVLVSTEDDQMGWVSLPFLAIDEDLSAAPYIASAPPDSGLAEGKLAPIIGQQGGSTAAAPATGGPAAAEESSAAFSIPTMTEIAAARVVQPESRLYRQPAADASVMTDVYVDENVSILAVNSDRTWALVKPDQKTPGWIPLSNVEPSSPLTAAPVVETAWVESNGVQVRSGPGVYYDQVGTLAVNDMVAMLGQSENLGWALVKPILGGGEGWTPFHFLDIRGSWNDVPKLAADVLAGSAAAPAAAAAPGVPAPSGDPTGALAVQLASGGDIMLINADGSGLRRLTSGIDPMLSPNGQQVAFTRWEYGGESSALWIMNTDGSGERAILGEMRKAKGPDWSPDGSRIILNYQDGGELEPKKQCQPLIDSETEDKAKISLPPNAYDPKVEIRDGMPYLCWKVPADAFWSLRVVDVAGGSYEGVYGGRYAFRPAWDASSDWRVVVDSGYGLLETDANRSDASESRGLTAEQGEGSPAISADGRFIASVMHDSGAYDIHRLNADGSGRVRLTTTPLWVTGRGLDRWNNVAPVWSPDGAYIAFLTDRGGRWEVWVMNADGANPHPLFSEEINNQLPIQYDFNDERGISWR